MGPAAYRIALRRATPAAARQAVPLDAANPPGLWHQRCVAPIEAVKATHTGDAHMATYISLVRYTDQGIRNIKESPNRLDATKKAFQAAGGELKQFYLAMGKYDIVLVSEAPDDETVARVALSLGSLGNVRTQTMRVFSEPEFRKIVGSLK
jgi:uncharacterized protein with GYD domain